MLIAAQEHSRYLLLDHLKSSGHHITLTEAERKDLVEAVEVEENDEDRAATHRSEHMLAIKC